MLDSGIAGRHYYEKLAIYFEHPENVTKIFYEAVLRLK